MTSLTPLRRVRFEREFIQYDLMARTGIPQSKISLIERGYSCPNREEAKRIAKVLGVKLSEVFPDEEQAESPT